MNKKVAAFWLSLVMVLSAIVIVDIITDFSITASGGTTHYVNTTGSGGAFTSIQDAINASNDGDIVFVYNGTYYENVVVNKTINLTGEDKDSTIINGSGSGDVVKITANWVNVSCFTITNSGSSGYDAGLLVNTDKNTIYDNNAINNHYGIVLSTSSGNNITGNNVSSNNESGIYLVWASNNTIIGNNVFSNKYNGIYFDEPQSDNCTITKNNISNNGHGIYLALSSNSSITDNYVFSNNGVGIYLSYLSNNHVMNNTLSNNGGGIVLTWSSNNNITGNDFINCSLRIEGVQLSHYNTHTIPDNNKVNDKPLYYYKNSTSFNIDGISIGQIILANCTEVDVRNLQINNIDLGMQIAYSTNINITNNNVSDNSQGIHLYSSSGNYIISNNVLNNVDQGINLRSSSDNHISNNNVTNSEWGISMIWSSNDNIITNNSLNNISGISISLSSGNNITNNNLNNRSGIYLSSSSSNDITNNNLNNGDGIYLHSSSNNTITNNDISNNINGIELYSSSDNNIITGNNVLSNEYNINISLSLNNIIYHNNFIVNTNQAYDDTNIGNQWDNGYPSGGNYWSDYVGVDNYKGSNQDILGSDGIGDTNYSIDSDSVDRYPLIRNHAILREGWNLVSISLIQSDSSLSSVLQAIQGGYDAIQWYNSTEIIDQWKHYHVSKPSNMNDLDVLDHKIGFWIHINSSGETLFVYNGTKPTENQTIQLNPGWNLVGYPSLGNWNRTTGLNNLTIGDEVDSIWTHNAATQKWMELGESDYFEIGRGYWIHAKTQCEWEVPL